MTEHKSNGRRSVEAFKAWYAEWWKNDPNPIAESNAQAAFFAGWDAAEPKQTETKSSQDFALQAPYSEPVMSEDAVERACAAYESTNAFGPERETRMRAALKAAGVGAPRLDRDKLSNLIDKKLDGDCGYGVGEYLADAIIAAFPATPVDEAELAEVIREAKAEAWGEALDSCNDYVDAAPNPYRQEGKENDE